MDIRLLFIVLFLSFFSHSQTEEIQDWKNKHPHIILIEENDASFDLLKKLELKHQPYIIYKNQFTVEDVEMYNKKNKISITENNIEDQNEIKIWKANHPDVTIISLEEFNLLPIEKQKSLMQGKVLVYQGKELVVNDLNEYDAK